MSAQPHKISYTVEEYLAYERSQPTKHEYLDGAIYAQAGTSQRHNLLLANSLAALHGQLRKSPCTVYPSDMRIKAHAVKFYTYPDLSVVCGQHEFDDTSRDTITNPTVIIEILSPSTERYDRGRKFQYYRTIPSFREYLLIAQDRISIEHFTRQPTQGRFLQDAWLMVEYTSLDDVIHLETIGCDLVVADLYEKTEVAYDIEPDTDTDA